MAITKEHKVDQIIGSLSKEMVQCNICKQWAEPLAMVRAYDPNHNLTHDPRLPAPWTYCCCTCMLTKHSK